MIRLSLCLLPCCVLAVVSPASRLVEGFVSGYTGEDSAASGCARPEHIEKVVAMVEELAEDVREQREGGLMIAHAAQLYEDLTEALEDCGLTLTADLISEWIHREGLEALLSNLATNEELLEGTAAKIGLLLEAQDWTEAGKALGEAVTALVPHAYEGVSGRWEDEEALSEVEATTQSVNFFQKLDNFTAGVFVGFESNPKKPVACLTTYNTTAQYFKNTSAIIEGCVRLYITDCQKIRDMVPDVIIHLQALVLSCKLQDLWESIINLADPSAWSQIVVAYYWNMATITSTWTDLLQSYIFKKYRQMGVDFGTIIRIVLNFKLN